MFSNRRTRFALIVLASQLLLIALSFVMMIEMILISTNGLVQFVENNPLILAVEIILTVLITVFGIFVFIVQLKRLGEKRNSDERNSGNSGNRRL
jgi:hypothetical protein